MTATIPDLAGQKILVTGSDGFIGSHVVETLLDLGAHVRAFALYNSFGSLGWLDSSAAFQSALETGQAEFVLGDIRDAEHVTQSVAGVDVVLHLAALIAIPYSYVAPRSYVDTNITGTLNVLEAVRKHGTKRLVHTSTSEVYGTPETVPITEDHPLRGQSPYSASKIGADQMALSFHLSFDTPVAIIRPFNTYGPRQSARAILPTIITQIASGQRRLRLGALHPTRDFSYIKDTIRGFIAVAEATATVGNVVNVGSNYEISIGDAVQMISELMGTTVEVEAEPARVRPEKSEVNRLRADNKKARQLAGWTPHYAGIEGFRKGIEETIAWYRDSRNLAHYKADLYNV